MRIVTSLLVLLCLAGCSNIGKHKQILNQAEGVIEYQADSAYSLLSSLRIDDIRGKKNRARYALLYSKVLDKQQKKITSDTLMSVAMDYYQDHGSPYHRASAYLYSARIDYNSKDIPEAVKKLTFAQEIAPLDSLYLRGLIYGSIGMCYSEQLNHEKALENYEEECRIFSQLDIKHNVANSLHNQASHQASLRNYDKAVDLCRQSREIYRELGDTANVFNNELSISGYNIRNMLGNALLERRRLFELREQYSNLPKTKEEYDLLSDLYWSDMPDSSAFYQVLALTFCDTMTLRDKSSFYVRYSRIAATTENYKIAYWRLKKANYYLNLFYDDNLEHSVVELDVKYRSKLYRARAEQLRMEKDFVIAISISLLLLIITLIYLVVRHYKNRLRKADEDLGIAQDLAQTITNTQNVLSITANDLQESERFDNINYMMSKLNTLIEKMPSYDKQPRKFIDEFVVVMRNQNKSGGVNTLFHEIIDRDYPDVLDVISLKYKLNSVEIEVLCMLALGVSNNAIRILMDHTNNRTIYNCRSSIKSKLNINVDSKSILEWLDSQQISDL
ncbi:MAG: hypothetical protein SNG27_06260 [Rikenellaceae bacterium]